MVCIPLGLPAPPRTVLDLEVHQVEGGACVNDRVVGALLDAALEEALGQHFERRAEGRALGSARGSPECQ